ncbi:MAG: hypothetical protein PUC67_09690 [Coriobacteriaceae bacterium]|nr:hypothetical protein [Coriobacteriaceae bacterium]
MSRSHIGIDIGSTMTKVAIMDGDEVVDTLLRPTGFNSAVTGKFLEVMANRTSMRESMRAAPKRSEAVHAFMTCR